MKYSKQLLSLREVIEAFPAILDEKVMIASADTNGDMTWAVFQFSSDGNNYRTKQVAATPPAITIQQIEEALGKIAPDQVVVLKQMAAGRALADPYNLTIADYKALILEEASWDDDDIDSNHEYGSKLRAVAALIPVEPTYAVS